MTLVPATKEAIVNVCALHWPLMHQRVPGRELQSVGELLTCAVRQMIS